MRIAPRRADAAIAAVRAIKLSDRVPVPRGLALSVHPVIMVAMRSEAILSIIRSVPHSRFNASVFLAIVLGLGLVRGVLAIDDAQLAIDRVDGAGWSATNVVVDLVLPGTPGPSIVTVDRIRLHASAQELRAVRIECPELALAAAVIACAHARIVANFPHLGVQTLQGRVTYQRQSGAVELEMQSRSLFGGRAQVAAFVGQRDWRVSARLERVDTTALLSLARRLEAALPIATANGRLSAEVDAEGSTTLRSAKWRATFDELTANNASGTLASDKLVFTTQGSVRSSAVGWAFDMNVVAPRGQAYFDPVFLDFGSHPLTLRAQGFRAADGAISLQHFAVDHDGVAEAQGSARIDMAQAQPLRDLVLDLRALRFPGAYESFLQPFLLDSSFKALTTAGRATAQIEVADGVPRRAKLSLHEVGVDDGTKRFVLRGLSGDVAWGAGDDQDADVVLRSGNEVSALSWQGGTLLGLSLGASSVRFTAIGRNLRLLEPARLPLLDGSIDFEALRVRNIGLPSVAFMVDATIRPISVADVCRAFGWPEFGGSIGGTISKLRLRDGLLTLGTTLQAQVFDGRIAIKDLRLEDALAQWPRLRATIELDNLDLELVTSAFSFGRITGRLSGYVNELQLFNWQPVAFDANLFTPPNDRSRHRISQRAVENIGSIGGGGAGITQALSSGFLKFFDDFRYERLGWSCRLENDVCHMNGVAPAPNGGYYLVKGSGLPRIDVIGGARRVDWPRLVNQLIAITESAGPVVE